MQIAQTAINSGIVLPLLRGDVYWVDLEPVVGHEKGKVRPAVVIQNDVANEFGALVTIAVITSKNVDKKAAYKVFISKGEGGLTSDSMVDCAQIRTVDKARFQNKIGHLPDVKMADVNKALKVHLDLN